MIVMKFLFLFLCFSLNLSPSTVQANTPPLSSLSSIPKTACIIPGTEAVCHKLVSELPWPFTIHVKEEKLIRINYLSSKEIQQSENKYLKMFLDINDYENQKEVAERFAQIHQEADPDMGLSYGWDLVTILGKRLYHLHADCTLAEHHFNSMVKTLEQIIDRPDNPPPPTLLCRCGGGCKQNR